MTRSIDLNCDLGEGCPNDAELMLYISSANIACGMHAGNRTTMRMTVELAIEHQVTIGAHPGYPDRENFGRFALDLSEKELFKTIEDQVSELREICDQKGVSLRHVKPHGALYNRSAADPNTAALIAECTKKIDSRLILFGLSESYSIKEAERIGLRTASEVFADRTYRSDRSLTPRSEPYALIHDSHSAAEQALDLVKYGLVRSTDGVMLTVKADTICLHGDGPNAVEFAKTIRSALSTSGFAIKSVE